MKTSLLKGLVAVALFTLAGCATYIPPNPKLQPIAYVRGAYTGETRITITQVNGQTASGGSDRSGAIMIPAGPCRLRLYYYKKDYHRDHKLFGIGSAPGSEWSASGYIQFKAQQNRTYVIGAMPEPRKGVLSLPRVRFFAMDAVTRKIVTELPTQS